MIKLVVFDWNGVLIADAKANSETVSYILTSYGRKPIDLRRYREIFEIPARNIYLKQGFSEKEVNREAKHIQEMFHTHYEPRIAHVRTRSGTRGLLEWLSKREIECVILSNHNIKGVKSQLRRLQIDKYFSHVLANDKYEAMKRQNKLEKLTIFLKANRFKKGEILIIGDSTEEIDAGKGLGIRTVAITGGYISTRRLREGKPDHLIHNLLSVIDIIKKV